MDIKSTSNSTKDGWYDGLLALFDDTEVALLAGDMSGVATQEYLARRRNKDATRSPLIALDPR